MSDSSVRNHDFGESRAIEITGKIMVVAIIILFSVVVFFLFLHLYARGFWWRAGDSTAPQLRSRRRRRFVFASGEGGALRGGLDPSVLRSLPVVVFQPQDFKEGLECAVCLSELVQGEKARLLPKCNHGFHLDCIDMWFQSHSTCPLCRNPVPSKFSSNDEHNNASQNNESSNVENSADANGLESPTFPTNVLIWGDQTQISSTGTSVEESSSPQPSSSSSCIDNCRHHGMLVIDIPNEITSSSLSPSASRFAEDEMKSPMTGRLRSLKRLLSRDRRLNPWSPSSTDVEQAGGGQN